MQTSQVFNQKHWPQAGDTDDCWVLSSIQAANVSSPWLPLPSVTEFRRNAGDPDDGKNDGGNLHEIVEGITNTWPVLAGRLEILRAATWADFVAMVDGHRAVTVAVKSMFLPPQLQYGFGGYHQVTVAEKSDGRVMFANPLAPVYSKWDQLGDISDIKEAVLRYGADKSNTRSVYAVALPGDIESLKLHPLYRATIAATQAKLDSLLKIMSNAKGAAQDAEEALQAFIASVSL